MTGASVMTLNISVGYESTMPMNAWRASILSTFVQETSHSMILGKYGGCLISVMKEKTMDISNNSKLTINWHTRNAEAIRLIRERFKIPSYTTVNGWTPCEIAPEDMPMFEETARRGYFSILRRPWKRVGDTYTWR